MIGGGGRKDETGDEGSRGSGVYGNEGKGVQLGFFFFQAEDGIRGISVTGVQTCALPI